MLGAALIGVIAVALSVVIGGPMTVLVERQQARAAADASALAVLWWGAAVADDVARRNGAVVVDLREQFVDGGRRSTVTVQVGSASAQAAASDALDG